MAGIDLSVSWSWVDSTYFVSIYRGNDSRAEIPSPNLDLSSLLRARVSRGRVQGFIPRVRRFLYFHQIRSVRPALPLQSLFFSDPGWRGSHPQILILFFFHSLLCHFIVFISLQCNSSSITILFVSYQLLSYYNLLLHSHRSQGHVDRGSHVEPITDSTIPKRILHEQVIGMW